MRHKTTTQKQIGPVKQRFVVLDALRGFALLGIILANFPEFSLWTFQNHATPDIHHLTADNMVQALLCFFVDGKFYTLFSLLFGIGFSIIIGNAMSRGADGRRIFYRRMTVLCLIGLVHLLLLWSGDILLLYALMGMLLPLFWKCTDRQLLRWAAFFLLLPVAIDLSRWLTGYSLADGCYEAWWAACDRYGVTEENFGTWLRDGQSYGAMHSFLMQGAVERIWEFVSGNRYFKVLGLFLIGLYIGRQRLYANLHECREWLRKVQKIGFAMGLPLSVFYTWSSIGGHPWGPVVHSMLYALSVYPMGIAYAAAFCLLYENTMRERFRTELLKTFERFTIHKDTNKREVLVWNLLAQPGKMALTCYLSQSLCGVILFYGVGFGMGADTSLWMTELWALGVFIMQIALCALWLRYFRFGPLEWIWRMLTYGQWLKLRKEQNP